MASNGQQNALPDIASILATLSQYTPQNDSTLTPTLQESTVHKASSPSIDQPALSSQAPFEKPYDPRLSNRPQQGSSTPQQQRTSTASPRPTIDPATIITWPEALRCVTKIAAQNQSFATSIRRMIADQKRNEMRWYSERQALKQNQAARSASAAKALSLLAGVKGGQSQSTLASASGEKADEVDKDAELRAFDEKIYAALLSMEWAMTSELKGLGVPFFGTPGELVMADGEVGGGEGKGKVTGGELVALRRRMVAYLEDMYKD
ncbi:hypothetical protein MBLNU230_g2018t1 [Neophaeotheca triangularis]